MEGVHKRNEFYVISLWVVFFFIAFRSPTVGGDTENYYRFFEGTQNYYNAGDNRDLEPMFLAYNYILGFFLARSGFLYMISNTVLCLINFKILIDKYSSFKSLSVLLFFLICDYIIYFVALRQGLAIQIFMYGIIYVMGCGRKKWIVYIVCSLLGSLFHSSIIIYSIVVGALYFVYVNKFIYGALIISSFCIGILFRSFDVANLFDLYLNAQLDSSGRYDGYMENDYWMSDNSFSLYLAIRPSIWGLLVILFLDKKNINHWFTKIHLISICIYNLFVGFSMTSRLNCGFSVFSIIVLSWVFPRDEMFNKILKVKKVIFLSVIIFLLRSFILNNIGFDPQDDAKMHPYRTFIDYM